LRFSDHNDTQVKGGFGRKLRAAEVIKYRDDWVRRVRERRELADKLVVDQMAARSTLTIAEEEVVWESPSAKLLAVHVNGLPDMLKHSVAEANKIWEGDYHGIVPGMSLIFDVLSGAWAQLASWVDPNHFAETPPREYISKFIADRNIWNRMLTEPRSYGERARTGTIETLDRTLVELQDSVEQMVFALTSSYIEGFDFPTWKKRWDKAKYIG
jgi:hypothetical protein